MFIRSAQITDFAEIEKIYDFARKYMRENGNPNQWKDQFPLPSQTNEDIHNGNLYVLVEEEKIFGVFAFIIGIDPTYLKIEGRWVLDDLPYGTIHRIASNGKRKGIFGMTLNYCLNKIDNIRIDTHEDNLIMQNALLKYGFAYCGIIHIRNNEPRLAYQLMKKDKK